MNVLDHKQNHSHTLAWLMNNGLRYRCILPTIHWILCCVVHWLTWYKHFSWVLFKSKWFWFTNCIMEQIKFVNRASSVFHHIPFCLFYFQEIVVKMFSLYLSSIDSVQFSLNVFSAWLSGVVEHCRHVFTLVDRWLLFSGHIGFRISVATPLHFQRHPDHHREAEACRAPIHTRVLDSHALAWPGMHLHAFPGCVTAGGVLAAVWT